MKKPARKIHLNDEQTARLLQLGLNAPDANACRDVTDRRRELLSDMLCSKLPVDQILMKRLPSLLKALSEELTVISGAPLGNYLTNPSSKPVVLRHIKDHAKTLGGSAKSKMQEEVAKIVYFAAIAAALAFHQTRLSEQSYQDLQRSFQLCGRQDWIPKDLAKLFAEAEGICRRRAH